MYQNTSTSKAGHFIDHFQKPNHIDIPGPDIEKHPSGIAIEIKEWLQCIEFPIIFILSNDKTNFFCSHPKCNRWYCLSGTFGNIKAHIKCRHIIKKTDIEDISHNQPENIYDEIENVKIPANIDRLISSKFKCMILKTGRPFSLVSNKDMKSVLSFLGTRQNLAEKCESIAGMIKSKIKFLLASSSFISVAVDEWTDLNKRRYLGVTARCLEDGEVKTYFLSLAKIKAIHLTGDELNNLFNDILDKYSFREKIMTAFSDNCNLMENSFTYSNILRLPCACHLINLFLKAFLKPPESTIKEITSSLKCINTVCYTALKEDFDEPSLKIFNSINIKFEKSIFI